MASSPLLPLLTTIPRFCSGKGSPLLMPFLEVCLHRARNLISTFPEGECLVTSARHLQAGRALLQSQQALTAFKQSLAVGLYLQRIYRGSQAPRPFVMMRLKGCAVTHTIPCTQLPPLGGAWTPLSMRKMGKSGKEWTQPRQWEATNGGP